MEEVMEERNKLLQKAAFDILNAAENNNIKARLLGGTAVYILCSSAHKAPLSRRINDLDFVVAKRQAASFGKLLTEFNFKENRRFNSIHGDTRMLFEDDITQVDIFVGKFLQCHEFDLEKQIAKREYTIPLADLLLTKLQIVEINEKDLLDILSILKDYSLDTGEGKNLINVIRIIEVTSKDWGWYMTVFRNLKKIHFFAEKILEPNEYHLILESVSTLQNEMINSDKSLNWKARAIIGSRIIWYNLPEEKMH